MTLTFCKHKTRTAIKHKYTVSVVIKKEKERSLALNEHSFTVKQKVLAKFLLFLIRFDKKKFSNIT